MARHARSIIRPHAMCHAVQAGSATTSLLTMTRAPAGDGRAHQAEIRWISTGRGSRSPRGWNPGPLLGRLPVAPGRRMPPRTGHTGTIARDRAGQAPAAVGSASPLPFRVRRPLREAAYNSIVRRGVTGCQLNARGESGGQGDRSHKVERGQSRGYTIPDGVRSIRSS